MKMSMEHWWKATYKDEVLGAKPVTWADPAGKYVYITPFPTSQ
jgi:hypothetical protein